MKLWTRRRALAQSVAVVSAVVAAPAVLAARAPLVIWWTPEGAPALRRIGERFTRDTGVPVVVETPDEGPAKFQQAASAGKGPDLFVYAHDRIGEWIAGGLIQPVHPGRAMLDDIDPLAWRGFTLRGRVWGYPFALEAITLIYNKALVSRPPATWEDVFEIDRQLVRQGKRAILWDYTNNYFTWPMLAARGGYPFRQRPDGSFDGADTGVNHPGAVEGAQVLQRLIREGVMPVGSGYPEMEAAMAAGRVGMMINGPWAWVNLRRAGLDFGVAKLPRVGDKPSVPCVGVKGFVLNRASRHRELCAELMEHHVLTLDGLREMNAAEPMGAAASRRFFAEVSAAEPRVATIMASAQDGIPTPSNPEMGRFWSTMKTALTNLTEGRQSPKEALDAAARRLTLS
jgi:maltose/maltodextrin transport system substrate-binding protein